jgi:hypothetical protein
MKSESGFGRVFSPLVLRDGISLLAGSDSEPYSYSIRISAEQDTESAGITLP